MIHGNMSRFTCVQIKEIPGFHLWVLVHSRWTRRTTLLYFTTTVWFCWLSRTTVVPNSAVTDTRETSVLSCGHSFSLLADRHAVPVCKWSHISTTPIFHGRLMVEPVRVITADRMWVWFNVSEGLFALFCGKMGKTGCKIIGGAPTTLAVKGLVMMMMMNQCCVFALM